MCVERNTVQGNFKAITIALHHGSLERSVRERTGELETALRDVETQTAERIKAERALRQAQKMEALGKLAGGVAHDFNNLLTVIAGGLDMIRRKPDDAARVTRLTDRAMMAVARCEGLTKQMLVFAGRQVMHPQTVDLNELITDFEPLIRHALGANIALTMRLDPGLRLSRIDRQQFEPKRRLSRTRRANESLHESESASDHYGRCGSRARRGTRLFRFEPERANSLN